MTVRGVLCYTCHKYWNANLGCHQHGPRHSGASIEFLHNDMSLMQFDKWEFNKNL
jgi:hypothetical protein